jgi:hypothetical protein
MDLSAKLSNRVFIESKLLEFWQIFKHHEILKVFQLSLFQIQESQLIKAFKLFLINILIVSQIVPAKDQLPELIESLDNLEKNPPTQASVDKYQSLKPWENRLAITQLNY